MRKNLFLEDKTVQKYVQQMRAEDVYYCITLFYRNDAPVI